MIFMLQSHKVTRHSFPAARIKHRTTDAALSGRTKPKGELEMLKRIVGITSLALLPFTAGAATLIIPAAGTGPGANGSQWSSDLIVHNASAFPASIDLVYHDANGATSPKSFVVGPHTTVTSGDVVRNV